MKPRIKGLSLQSISQPPVLEAGTRVAALPFNEEISPVDTLGREKAR